MLAALLLALTLPVLTPPEPSVLPAPDAPPPGWDAVPTGAVQGLAGTGACCVAGCLSIPLAFVPVVGPVVANVIAGVLVGTTETVVGDAVGNTRGALLWPVLTSSGIFVAGGIAATVASVAVAVTVPVTFETITSGTYLAAAFIPVGIAVATSVAGVAVPVVAYHLTAVPKEPGDAGGFGMPGIAEPADPTGTRTNKAAPPTPPPPPPPATSTTPATSDTSPTPEPAPAY
jgi:hypothetical protein